MSLFLRWVATAIAVAVTAFVVPGISVVAPDAGSKILTLFVVAALIGLVNAVVKPVVTTLSGCLIMVTFGLFLLVINALLLMLVSWLSQSLGFGFVVGGFLSAVIGSLLISVVSSLVSGVLGAGRN